MSIEGDPNFPPLPSEGDLSAFLRAIHFAADRHRDQRRKGLDASPYINHPIAVAELLASVAGVEEPHVLQAAVLHDVVEDTETSLDELADRFGPRVAAIVGEVSDDKDLDWDDRKEEQVRGAKSLSPEAKLIRVADKICNVYDVGHRPPEGWSPGRRRAYVAWTARVVEGCRGVSGPLEARFDEVREDTLSRIPEDRPAGSHPSGSSAPGLS
jgi:guanosine-3',5'-bis(diphosphate) 3'-pyrophosphohydrolase